MLDTALYSGRFTPGIYLIGSWVNTEPIWKLHGRENSLSSVGDRSQIPWSSSYDPNHCISYSGPIWMMKASSPLLRNSPKRARAASFVRFIDHSEWYTTVGRTPLDEGSACRRDLYLTTHNTHKRKTFVYPAEFEPAVPAIDQSPTLALDRSASEIGVQRSRRKDDIKIVLREVGCEGLYSIVNRTHVGNIS